MRKVSGLPFCGLTYFCGVLTFFENEKMQAMSDNAILQRLEKLK